MRRNPSARHPSPRPPTSDPPPDTLPGTPPPDPPPPDTPSPPDRPKISLFFSSSRPKFLFVLSLRLFVEFRWCLKRWDPPKCHFGVLRVIVCGPVWCRHDDSENSKRRAPMLQTPKFHEKTPRKSTQSEILGGKSGKKKREILPPFWAHPSGPHHLALNFYWVCPPVTPSGLFAAAFGVADR